MSGEDEGRVVVKAPKTTWAHVSAPPDYKPGDLPPEGYLQWHAWADVQRKAGIRQVECPSCSKWRTPQELSTHEVKWTGWDKWGIAHQLSVFQCAKCFEKAHPPTDGSADRG